MSSSISNESSDETRLAPGDIFDDEWEIICRIGEGGYGVAYKVKKIDEYDDNQFYALKVESVRKRANDVIKMEVHVLQQLSSAHKVRLFACGLTRHYNYMVMSLLGPNISDMRRVTPKGRFTTSTAVRIGKQALSAIKDLHTAGFIHRDIKAGNFALGRSDENKHRSLFILDFGFARAYRNDDGKIRAPRRNARFCGTSRYASLNMHYEFDASRRDDLFSWLYMFIEMINGELPWRHSNDKETAKLKEACRVDCSKYGPKLPVEINLIQQLIYCLGFADKPDYYGINGYLTSIERYKRSRVDDPFDWEEGGHHQRKFESHLKCTSHPTMGSCLSFAQQQSIEQQ